MEKFVYLNNLFDLYSDLLTEKQQNYFKEYYFNNLSYGEISEKYKVSRNAVYRQIQLISEKLEFFEEKLQLFDKKRQINDILNMIDKEDLKEKLENLF